jgi:pimeloyl-ACP methyl ester carboxylesterase
VRALLLALVCAGLVAGCGAGHATRTAERRGDLVYEQAGQGPGRVTVIRPAGASGPLPLVLFLHGWGATETRFYRPWLEHLARAGNAVIYPRYQDSIAEPPTQVPGNVLVGVRQALEDLDDADLDSLVVARHSAGGALAADYASIARSVGLPEPRAVLSMYPGRAFRGARFAIPAVDPGRIPPDTRLVVLTGADDRVVDPRDARAIHAGADRVKRNRYEIIRTPGASDHLAPQRSTRVSRKTFWARLDALIAQARA